MTWMLQRDVPALMVGWVPVSSIWGGMDDTYFSMPGSVTVLLGFVHALVCGKFSRAWLIL